MTRYKCLCFAEATRDTLMWLVIDACALRGQRGIPYVARHACMALRSQRGIPRDTAGYRGIPRDAAGCCRARGPKYKSAPFGYVYIRGRIHARRSRTLSRGANHAFCRGSVGYLLWLVIHACVSRRQRGILVSARHTCMCFAGATWDTLCGLL